MHIVLKNKKKFCCSFSDKNIGFLNTKSVQFFHSRSDTQLRKTIHFKSI